MADRFTPRGTILGGRLDCFVRKTDGVAFVTRGRTATLDEADTVDTAFRLSGSACAIGSLSAITSDDFVDALIYIARRDDEYDLDMQTVARRWLRQMVLAGLNELRGNG